MKIVIRTEETNLTLRLPGFLLYGRLSSRIAGGLARKYLPAEMPLLTIRLRVLRPMCIIFVPVSACCMLLVTATE